MKLKINGYEVEITAHGEGSSDEASTMVLLDQIANGCSYAAMKDTDFYRCKAWIEIAHDIHEALEKAGLYT